MCVGTDFVFARHGLPTAAALCDEGRFLVPIEAAFPLDQAAAAHTAASNGPRRGKIALIINTDKLATRRSNTG